MRFHKHVDAGWSVSQVVIPCLSMSEVENKFSTLQSLKESFLSTFDAHAVGFFKGVLGSLRLSMSLGANSIFSAGQDVAWAAASKGYLVGDRRPASGETAKLADLEARRRL